MDLKHKIQVSKAFKHNLPGVECTGNSVCPICKIFKLREIKSTMTKAKINTKSKQNIESFYLSEKELLKAIQFRFRTIPDNAQIDLHPNKEIGVEYVDEVLGCRRDCLLTITHGWMEGLLNRHLNISLELNGIYFDSTKNKPTEHFKCDFKKES